MSPGSCRGLCATLSTAHRPPARMTRHHIHLLSDSTGETLEMIAKAALAQFEEALRALYAPDPKKLAKILDQWPQDVASYIRGRTNAIGSIWTASTKI